LLGEKLPARSCSYLHTTSKVILALFFRRVPFRTSFGSSDHIACHRCGDKDVGRQLIDSKIEERNNLRLVTCERKLHTCVRRFCQRNSWSSSTVTTASVTRKFFVRHRNVSVNKWSSLFHAYDSRAGHNLQRTTNRNTCVSPVTDKIPHLPSKHPQCDRTSGSSLSVKR